MNLVYQCDMHLDFSETAPRDRYKVLTALVVPRPIAWVSTRSLSGRSNIAPFSFFSVMGSRPPIVAFAPGNKSPGIPKDTARNILETKEFVVNLVDESTAPQMVASAEEYPEDVSEIARTNLTEIPSLSIKAPRIKESPVSMECSFVQELLIGENRMIIGEIHHVHVRDGVLDPDSYQLIDTSYAPIGRLGSPDYYCRTGDTFQM